MARSMPAATRGSLADLLVQRVRPLGSTLARSYREAGPINHFVVDDTFPEPVARLLAERFPTARDMMRRSTIRESKYVSSQMDRHDPLIEEVTFAFQDRRFVALLSEITGIADLAADPILYASGLSLMRQGDFLHPHLDNSHDKDRERYRVLNVLYYVTPDWALDCGGNLELWDRGPDGAQRTIESRFNRLVCMTTHRGSWHSVSPVRVPRERTCVSNYYFSGQPLGAGEYFHVTSFRGRPEQGLRDLVLRVDTMLRAAVRRVYRKGVVTPKHVYKKSSDSRS